MLPQPNRRDVLRTAAAGLATTLVGRRAFAEAHSDLIRAENERPGTRDWMNTNVRVDPATRYRSPGIEGFASRTSVRPGESIAFQVSTNPASSFTIDLYRLGYYQGHGGRFLTRLGPFSGAVQPDPPVGEKRLRECRWEPCATLTIPEDWPSGVYLGKLTAEREGLQSYVIFIVRDDRKCDFLFQCSDHTWNAYNRWPSQFALYDNGQKEWYWGGDVQVSFDRPYGKYCQILDAPLSVGHDEYWSLEMYNNVKRAIDQGVNVAFLSGNALCGRVAISPSSDGRPGRIIERIGLFGGHDDADQGFPEMATLTQDGPSEGLLIGARNMYPVTGGGAWICRKPDHWLFEGTGMAEGDGIPGLVGWEWHGDPAEIPGLEVVARGPTDNGSVKGEYAATIYPGPNGNHVFNAATIWWADGLSEPPGYLRPKVYTEPKGPDPRVQRITRNLLERFRQS
jgi:hypothetical protein